MDELTGLDDIDAGIEAVDYGLLPDQQRRRMLPRALRSVGGTLTQAAQTPPSALPAAVEAYRRRAAGLYQQGTELMDQDVDTSALQAFARQQGRQGDTAMLNAMAAQYAGESFQPVQAQFLKRATAAREPIKLAQGMLTPDGQFIRDPFASQEKRVDMLLQQAKSYEQMALTAQTTQERNEALQAQNEIANMMRAMGLQIQQQNANTQATLAAGPGGVGGTFQPSGKTPDGRSIVVNTRNGINYLVDVGPNGQPSYMPYTGPSVPNAAWEKNITDATELSGAAAGAERLIKLVESNPGAFGLRGALVGTMPGGLQSYVAQAVGLTNDQMRTRAEVMREAAMEVNRLYGAALSMGEQARASSFLPDAKDDFAAVINKLQAARAWAQSKLGQMPPGVQRSTQQRSGGGAAPGGAVGGGGGITVPNAEDPLGLRRPR